MFQICFKECMRTKRLLVEAKYNSYHSFKINDINNISLFNNDAHRAVKNKNNNN